MHSIPNGACLVCASWDFSLWFSAFSNSISATNAWSTVICRLAVNGELRPLTQALWENSLDSLNSSEKLSLVRDSAGLAVRGSGIGVDVYVVFGQVGRGLVQDRCWRFEFPASFWDSRARRCLPRAVSECTESANLLPIWIDGMFFMLPSRKCIEQTRDSECMSLSVNSSPSSHFFLISGFLGKRCRLILQSALFIWPQIQQLPGTSN